MNEHEALDYLRAKLPYMRFIVVENNIRANYFIDNEEFAAILNIPKDATEAYDLAMSLSEDFHKKLKQAKSDPDSDKFSRLERKIDIVDKKLDLLFKSLLVVPFYTKAISEKNPRAPWNKAVRETRLIAREYDEILKIQNENIDDPSCKQT